MGGNIIPKEEIWNKCFFLKYTLHTIIATPRNYYESNISEVYSHSFSQFWALQGDYEHEIIQPWLPVSQKYINRKENKAQIPLIIHHNEKKLGVGID